MTIREVFDKFLKDKSSFKQEPWVELSDICSCFEIYDYVQQDDDNPRFTVYFLHSWYCTDSWVGYRVWLLDGEPIAITYQCGRKYDEEFSWLPNGFDKAHKVILELHGVKKLDYNPMTPEDWDREMVRS
jgi:hypothetical protein